jgi:hypothetical protein
MKLKRVEVDIINTTLDKICEEFEELDTILAYGIAKNKVLIRNEIESISKLKDQLIKRDNKRIEICKKYALKDENGDPIIKDGVYKIDEDDENFKKDFYEFKDKYDKEFAASVEFLEEEIEISVYPMSINLFPKKISVEYIKALLPLIKED